VGAVVSEWDGQHASHAVARLSDLCRGVVRRPPGHGFRRWRIHFRGIGL